MKKVSHMHLKQIIALVTASLLTISATAQEKSIPEPPGAASNEAVEQPLFSGEDFTTSTVAILTSDYLWRGISVSGGQPAIQAQLELNHKSGLFAGIFNTSYVGPVNFNTDPYAGYDFKFKNGKIRAGALWYTYPLMPVGNTVEYVLQASYKRTRFDAGFMDKFPGPSNKKSSTTYLRLAHSVLLTSRHLLNLGVGYSMYGDTATILWKEYLDYKVGLTTLMGRNMFELSWNDTTRKSLADVKAPDKTVVATLIMPF